MLCHNFIRLIFYVIFYLTPSLNHVFNLHERVTRTSCPVNQKKAQVFSVFGGLIISPIGSCVLDWTSLFRSIYQSESRDMNPRHSTASGRSV